jgi:hypothetical protein
VSEPPTGPQPVRPKTRPSDPTVTGDLADAVVPPRRRSTTAKSTQAKPASAKSSGSTSKTGSHAASPRTAAPVAAAAVATDDMLGAPVAASPRTTVTGTQAGLGPQTAPSAPVQPNSNTRGMPRRVRLRITRVGPGTVAQVTFLITAMLAIAGLVTVTIMWFLLTKSGVLTNSQSLANAIFGSSTTTIDLTKVFSLPRLLLLSAIWGVFQVVVVTFVAWFLAVAYNAIVRLTGGIELTLSDHA